MYFDILFFAMLSMEAEPIFYFLPMTEKEIKQYITDRMVLVLGGITALSVGAAALLKLIGISVFLERGAMSTLALLDIAEVMVFVYLYDNREKAKEEKPRGKAKARKVRGICYFVFMLAAFSYHILAGTLMELKEGSNYKIPLLIGIFCFAMMGLFYADMIRWMVDFTKFRKKSTFTIFGRSYSSENQKEGAAS